MQDTQMNRDEEIRQIAYRIWEEEGYPDGHEVQHWLRAKMILEEMNNPQRKPKQPKALKRGKSRKILAAETEL